MTGPIVMVVIVAVAALIAWFALEGTPWSATPTRTAASTPTPTSISTPTPSAPPTAAPREQAPSTDAPPAAEPATPSVAAPTADTPPTSAPTPREDPTTSATVPKADAPVDATPAPAPVRRPVIARVDVPTVVEGAPFTVALQLGTTARDVVSIERRVVDSSGAWPRLATQLQASGLPRAGDRTLLVPFRAMDAPSRAVVEFVAIGRDGVRSDAKRVAITLDRADPAVAALEIPVACTSATCGVVIESREIEPEVGTRGAIYQLSVRMDDRQVVTSTAPYRLQIGSRARLAGTRLVPADRPGR